jgi:CheY-like chemotaxis protein
MTDCHMPLMNGYELAKAWRRHESEGGRTTRLPIIAMTANALDGELERCREAGMDDHLSKPVQLRQLEEKILSWMPRATTEPTAAPKHDDVFAEPGMQEMRAEMLRMLVQTGDTDLRKLEQAVADGDSRQAAQALHRLLGALQLFTDDRVIADGRVWLERLSSDDAAETLREIPAYLKNLRNVLVRLAQETADS